MELRVTAYPNNERRIALFPEPLPKDLLRELSEVQCQSQDKTDESCECRLCLTERIKREQRVSAFNIKSKLDTVPRKPRLSLSRYGRRQILRAGSCFDNSETTQRLLLTGTLPGTGNRAHRALAENSSYASKTLTNWLNRRSPKCPWMYTWEFQGRGALHIHLVVELPAAAAAYVRSHFKDEWNRILREIKHRSGVDVYAKTKTYSHSPDKTQADVTLCTREPSRYISKYISKGNAHAKAFGRFPPKTWYQISRSLLAKLRERTVTYEVTGLSYSQALCAWETIQSVVSAYDLAGARRFSGAVLSAHGYYYHSDFDPLALHPNMQPSKRVTLPITTILRTGITTLERYPGAKAISHTTTLKALVEGMKTGTLSQSQLLLLGDTIEQCLGATWDGMRDKTSAAIWIRSYECWLEQHELETKITQTWRDEIDNICKLYLTPESLGTNLG